MGNASGRKSVRGGGTGAGSRRRLGKSSQVLAVVTDAEEGESKEDMAMGRTGGWASYYYN